VKIYLYLYNEGVELKLKGLKDFLVRNFGNISVRVISLPKEVVITKGILFDPLHTQKAFLALGYKQTGDSCHIVLTKRLFATFGEDERLHIRASVYSYPSVISTSGIVEGPAKPKEYQQYFSP